MEENGTMELLPKKEVIKLKLEESRLEKFLGGIKEMKKVPDALFVVDPKKERNAILEARKLGIPIIGIIDTNCDPEDVDYVIPANDDAIRSVKLIVSVIGNAILEGKQGEQFNFENKNPVKVREESKREIKKEIREVKEEKEAKEEKEEKSESDIILEMIDE